MEVLEYPNGVCAKHGPKLNVNGIPQCVKCVADAERAQRPAGPVVTVEDPGHEAMRAIVPDSKHVPQVPVAQPGQQAKGVGIPPVSRQLGAIRDAIYGLPMPRSMKQYKRLQKIQQLIDQALSEEDNG